MSSEEQLGMDPVNKNIDIESGLTLECTSDDVNDIVPDEDVENIDTETNRAVQEELIEPQPVDGASEDIGADRSVASIGEPTSADENM